MKKLNLGKELTKNQQKKIVGGATLVCSNGITVYNFGNCAWAASYCAGAHQSGVTSCTSGGGNGGYR